MKKQATMKMQLAYAIWLWNMALVIIRKAGSLAE